MQKDVLVIRPQIFAYTAPILLGVVALIIMVGYTAIRLMGVQRHPASVLQMLTPLCGIAAIGGGWALILISIKISVTDQKLMYRSVCAGWREIPLDQIADVVMDPPFQKPKGFKLCNPSVPIRVKAKDGSGYEDIVFGLMVFSPKLMDKLHAALEPHLPPDATWRTSRMHHAAHSIRKGRRRG